MYRQGDILLVPDAGPRGRRAVVADRVIAFGESTGHAHRVEGGALVESGGIRYVVAGPQGTRIVHEEHDEIVLPEGTYRVVRQREFGDGGVRQVAD